MQSEFGDLEEHLMRRKPQSNPNIAELGSVLHSDTIEGGEIPRSTTVTCKKTGFFDRLLTPVRLLIIFTFINLLNYVDRGVIPGSLDQIRKFVSGSIHSTNTAYVGLLQSIFILGYSISCIVFGRLVHSYRPFRLLCVGLMIWCFSIFLSGISPNYYFLLFSRALSGVGEASFQIIAPPFIDDRAPKGHKALWLSIFYIAIPVGTALGYIYGGLISNSSLKWRGAFLLETPMSVFIKNFKCI